MTNEQPSRTPAFLVLLFSLLILALSIYPLYLFFTAGDTVPSMRILEPGLTALLSLFLFFTSFKLFRRPRATGSAGDTSEEPEGRKGEAPAERAGLRAAPPPAATAPAAVPQGAEALLLLSLLQEKGRFVDFVMEDILTYSDAQVAAAARVVHQGCREVVEGAFGPRPIAAGTENAPLSLPAGFDAAEYRLVGRVQGEAPYAGRVVHPGWRASKVHLPRLHDLPVARENPVIIPAEVQV